MNTRKTVFSAILVVASLCIATQTACATKTEEQASSPKLQVFLLAGQSNMDGRGDGSALTKDDRARLDRVQDRVLFAYNHQDIRPLDITVPLPHIGKKFRLERTFGPELFFGLELAEASPDTRFLLIKRSQGGTSLYGCWNPDWSLEKATLMNEADEPRLYEDFSNYVRDVLSEYEESDYEISGMLWVQGETDSNDDKFGPAPAASYGENLRKLIEAIRRDSGVEDLPFFMLQVGRGDVVKGMQETAQLLDNVHYIAQSKDRDSPAYLPKYGPPTGHYNYEGMKRIGQLFSKTYLDQEPD